MRLILHAGTHKTGTTSIQKVLADNRAWLRERNLYYPDGGATIRSRLPHHEFAHGITRADPARHSASLAFIKEVRQNTLDGETIVISSEPIYRHFSGHDGFLPLADAEYWTRRRRYLEDMARTLHEFDVEVLLFFRRVDDYAVSLYSEAISKNRRRILRNSCGFLDFIDRRKQLFEYDAQISLFRSVFHNVNTLSYDHALDKGVIPTFFEAIGVAPPPKAASEWIRQSPDPRLLLWMARRRDRETNPMLRDFVTSDEAGQIFSDKVGFWPSVTARNEFLKQYGAAPSDEPTLPEARLSDVETHEIGTRFEAWAAKRGGGALHQRAWLWKLVDRLR